MPNAQTPSTARNGAPRNVPAGRNVLTLTCLNQGGWFATYTGPHTAGIVALFGTGTLPLPYTAQAAPAVVLAAVQAQNPACLVVLA